MGVVPVERTAVEVVWLVVVLVPVLVTRVPDTVAVDGVTEIDGVV